ncbi:MAG: SpoIVB peptidase [Solirubrobacterales bacterium]
MRKQKFNLLCWILIPVLFIGLIAHYKVVVSADIFASKGKSVSFSKILANSNTENIGNTINESNQNVVLYPGGQPIGVRINTKGVLVVALSDLETGGNKVASPGSMGGIEIGDSILSINGEYIISSEQVASIVNSLQNNIIKVEIERRGERLTKEVKPVKSDEGPYKIGLWVRDSTAGIGTLTFYEEKSGIFAALGHPITDMDTGTILSVNSGEILSSSINSVIKGAKGNPGELKGTFANENLILGTINKNTKCGIVGKTDKKLINKQSQPMKAAKISEIKEGPAQILTTVDGEEPKLYEIKVQKLFNQNAPDSKSMLICITDQELLEKTGGIVQGMSGSPIIQDGKIIGAVTHVLINKPDVGYGVYIEWMLKEANIQQ